MYNLIHWIPFALYSAVLTGLLLSPSDHLPTLLTDTSDKVLHFLAFALLMVLYLAGLTRCFSRHKLHWLPLLAGFAGMNLFSALLELIQFFVPGRQGSWTDFFYNNAGLLAGGILSLVWMRVRIRLSPAASR